MSDKFDKNRFEDEENERQSRSSDFPPGSRRVIRSKHNERMRQREEQERIDRDRIERERLQNKRKYDDEDKPLAPWEDYDVQGNFERGRDRYEPVNPKSYLVRGNDEPHREEHFHDRKRSADDYDKDELAGRDADKPSDIPARGFWAVAKRTYRELDDDNIGIVSAGIAFWSFLSLFPLLTAIISIYGLIYSPAAVQGQISSFLAFLPGDVRLMLSEQMSRIAGASSQTLGISLIVSIFLSLWAANKGMKALFTGINIAYDEHDQRGFFRENGLTLLFTLGAIVFMFLALAMVVGIPSAIRGMNLGTIVETVVYWARWPVLALMIIGALALLYKVAPYRTNPKFRWITWGSVIGAIVWIAASIGFSFYAENFGNYNETYGSMAAIIILLLWFLVSAFSVLLGAEINSELERQTLRDTTVGPDKPMGHRGATVADDKA